MAGKAQFRIEGEDATARAFNSVVARAQSVRDKVQGFTNTAFAVTGVTVFISKIAEAGRAAIELGDSLNKAAIKAGIGGREISELAYAAKLADVDLGSLSTSLKKMQVFISEASSGNKEAASTLHALGLEIDDLKGKKADKQFELIADQVSRLGSAEDRTRALTAIFGKAGGDLAPLFEQGAAGIRKAREEAEKLGFSFGDEALKSLAEADDAVKRLTASWEAFTTTLTVKVAPALTRTLNAAADGAYGRIGAGFLKGGFVGMFRAGLDEQQKSDDAQWTADHTGTIVRHEGRSPIGFAAQDAAERASKEAAKAEKEQEKFIDDYHAALRDMNADVDREADASLDKEMSRWMERQDAARDTYEKWKQGEKDLRVWREEQWQQSAQVFRDYFVNAIEDMINTGKFKWRDFLTFIVAELAKRKIAELFDSIFANVGKGGGNGGWLSTVVSAIGSAWGGGSSGGTIDGKAAGGPVKAGSMHWVGEKGPELAVFGQNANIIPNHALAGGGPSLTVVNHIDARGATVDAIKLLPSFGKQISEETERRIVERMRRNWYGLQTS